MLLLLVTKMLSGSELKTLALLEMLSLGGIITMMRTDTQKKDLIEHWLMLHGDRGTLW